MKDAEPEETVSFPCGPLVWTVERPHADSVRRLVAERVDALEGVPGVSLIKRNMVRAVFRVPFEEGDDAVRVVAVKQFKARVPTDWVKYLFKPSRAVAEWRRGRGLAAAGVPTAVPLAMAERRAGVLLDAALVTRWLPGTVHLNAYVEEHYGTDEEGARGRAGLYRELARIVRRMHDAGFVHNDLHGGNVLVAGDPSAPRVYLIDLHSVGLPAGGVSSGSRWKDIRKLLHSQLGCTTVEERRRFCVAYADAAT